MLKLGMLYIIKHSKRIVNKIVVQPVYLIPWCKLFYTAGFVEISSMNYHHDSNGEGFCFMLHSVLVFPITSLCLVFPITSRSLCLV